MIFTLVKFVFIGLICGKHWKMRKAKRLAAHHAKRGLRPDKVCLGCLATGPADSGDVTRHHLIPRASKGAPRGRADIKTMSLCVSCHKLVHDVWGEGHNFTGPTTEAGLIEWLVGELAGKV